MSRVSPRTMTRLRSGSLIEGLDVQPASPSSPKTPKSPSSDSDVLTKAQKDLLRTPKYSDLTVVCDTRRWECQRSILTQRCRFFAAALTHGFDEADSGMIELPEDDPEAVDVMLLYLYTLQRPDFTDPVLFPKPSLTATSVYKLADKYNIPDLRSTAKEYFLGLIKSSLSQWHRCNAQNQGLWVAWIPVFWDWSMEGSDEVRDAVIDALTKSAKSISEDASFQRMLLEMPDLGLPLIRALAVKAKSK